MRFSTITAAAAPLVSLALAQGAPGYTPVASTIAESNTTWNFGSHFAVLNLDLITGLVDSVVNTTAGDAWISSVQGWINAVHAHPSQPLQIFTRIYFQPGHPEVGPSSPFLAAASVLLNNTENSGASSQIYPAFNAAPSGYANGTNKDVVLQKTRYDATYATQLREILIAQKIDTVIIVSGSDLTTIDLNTNENDQSGIRTSGVVLSTTYTLFDEDFQVYVISNNSIESPPDTTGIDGAIKAGILPKLPVNVINIAQAEAALKRSP